MFQVRIERTQTSTDMGGDSAFHSRGCFLRHLEFRLPRLRHEHCSAVCGQWQPRHQRHHFHVLVEGNARKKYFNAKTGHTHSLSLSSLKSWLSAQCSGLDRIYKKKVFSECFGLILIDWLVSSVLITSPVVYCKKLIYSSNPRVF
jgi:hypothetical protein